MLIRRLIHVAVAIAFLASAWEWTRLSGLNSPAARIAVLVVLALVYAAAGWSREPRLWAVIALLGVAWWLVASTWLKHFSFGAAPTPEKP